MVRRKQQAYAYALNAINAITPPISALNAFNAYAYSESILLILTLTLPFLTPHGTY